jgi:hypothetical protein
VVCPCFSCFSSVSPFFYFLFLLSFTLISCDPYELEIEVMASDNARFVAILVAVAFPVAIWIGSDYLTHEPPSLREGVADDRPVTVHGVEATRAAIPAVLPESTSPTPRRERVIEGTVAAQPPASSPGAIHKCRVAGQVVYSDQPCSAETDLKSFTPSLAAVPVVATSRQAVLPPRPAPQAQPVEQMQPVQRVAAADATEAEKAKRDAECKWIDERIATIDARMRQPYHPSEGDRLKEERKALNDRRFTLGC